MNHNYEDYQKLIYSLAHRWESQDFEGSIDFDELVSIGNEAFVVATHNFDPNNGAKFSTYLYWRVNNAMSNAVTKANKRVKAETKIPVGLSINGNTSPEHMAILKSWVESLSHESQFIIHTVWNTPADIVQWAREENYNPKTTLKLIARYLRGWGWTWPVIRRSFKEIRAGLKSL